MALVIVLIALACSAHAFGPGPAGRLLVRSVSTALPAWSIVLLFPLLTIVFVAVKLTLTTVLALLIIIVVAGWQLGRVYESRREKARTSGLAAFLGLCAGNLRAGMSMAQAMDYALVSAQHHQDLTDRLSVAARRAAAGSGGAQVLIDAPEADLQRLGTLWAVSEHHGIPLVILIEQMRKRIDIRQRHCRSTRAALQGPQATAAVLTLLPLGGVAMGSAMGADPLGVLFGGGIGGLMLLSGVTCAAAGFVMTQKIMEAAT